MRVGRHPPLNSPALQGASTLRILILPAQEAEHRLPLTGPTLFHRPRLAALGHLSARSSCSFRNLHVGRPLPPRQPFPTNCPAPPTFSPAYPLANGGVGALALPCWDLRLIGGELVVRTVALPDKAGCKNDEKDRGCAGVAA